MSAFGCNAATAPRLSGEDSDPSGWSAISAKLSGWYRSVESLAAKGRADPRRLSRYGSIQWSHCARSVIFVDGVGGATQPLQSGHCIGQIAGACVSRTAWSETSFFWSQTRTEVGQSRRILLEANEPFWSPTLAQLVDVVGSGKSPTGRHKIHN